MHCCCQARGQDEDEMAPPQKIPQSCLSLCWSGWRGHTPWSGEHETSPPAPPNMAVLVVVAIPVSDVVPFSWWRASLPSSLVRWDERRTVSLRFHRGPATMRYSVSLLSCDSKIRCLPAECEWISDGPSAPHTSHVFRRSFGSSCRGLYMGDSEGPSAPHTSHEFNFLNGSSRRRRCLEDQENLIRTCERHFCQSYHTGWMVCSRCSLIRGIPAGRHGYLSRHAKRGRRGDARVALGTSTCHPHDKADRSWFGRDRIRSQNISGPVNNVEALLGAAGRRSGHVQVFCAKRRSCGGRHFPCSDPVSTKSTAIPMRGRQPRPDRSQLPHTGSRSLVRSPWTSYHPDPQGTDGVEVVARVQKDNFDKVLCGSGEFGVFSRPFFVKGDARVYKDVPLPVEFDLQAAMRKAKAVGPAILEVVLR